MIEHFNAITVKAEVKASIFTFCVIPLSFLKTFGKIKGTKLIVTVIMC